MNIFAKIFVVVFLTTYVSVKGDLVGGLIGDILGGGGSTCPGGGGGSTCPGGNGSACVPGGLNGSVCLSGGYFHGDGGLISELLQKLDDILSGGGSGVPSCGGNGLLTNLLQAVQNLLKSLLGPNNTCPNGSGSVIEGLLQTIINTVHCLIDGSTSSHDVIIDLLRNVLCFVQGLLNGCLVNGSLSNLLSEVLCAVINLVDSLI